MNESIGDLLYRVGETIVGYLPSLVGGLVLIALGWLLGWVAKRVVFQVCLVLRLDRLLRQFRWGQGFSRADARHALYDSVGNLAFLMVFVVLLNAALSAMKLTVLSDLLQRGILFIPQLLIALLILGAGTIVAGRAAAGTYRALVSENVPRARLIARMAKAVLLLFFSAMALTELGFARQIVLIGFATILITICVLIVLLAGLGGRGFLTRVLDGADQDRRESP